MFQQFEMRCLEESQKKEISVEDSLEHNRKRLDRLYKDIVTED